MENNAITTAPPAEVSHTPSKSYTGPTYYGRPSIKSSPYGWLVWSYIYVAGIAGGSQVIATIANLIRRPHLHSVVRHGRYIAVGGSAIGSALLIADLHTPQRWYNMMRIFRKTSPMSIGSYILTTFGLTSAITAAVHLFGMKTPAWIRRTETAVQFPAALAGAGMGSYTGALLSATSTPMWASSPRLLTARFASSAIATAAATLSLAEQIWGDRRNSNTLDKLACLATVADAALTATADRHYRREGVASSLHDGSADAMQYKVAASVGHALPLVCYGLGGMMPQHARKLSIAAALGVLAGGLLMRSTVLHAGNTSAQRPEDYFSYTQPKPSDNTSRLAHQHTTIGQIHGCPTH